MKASIAKLPTLPKVPARTNVPADLPPLARRPAAGHPTIVHGQNRAMIATYYSNRASAPLLAILGVWLCSLASGCGSCGGRQSCACGPHSNGYFALPAPVCFGYSSTCWNVWPAECTSCPTYSFPPQLKEPLPASVPEPAIQPPMDHAPVPDASPSDERPNPAYRHSMHPVLPRATAQDQEELSRRPTANAPTQTVPVQQPYYGSPSAVLPVVNNLPAETQPLVVAPPPAIEQHIVTPMPAPADAMPVAAAPLAVTQEIAISQPAVVVEQPSITQQPVISAEPEPVVTTSPAEHSRFLLSENPSFIPPTTPAISPVQPAPSEPPTVRTPRQATANENRVIVKSATTAPRQATAKRGFQLPALFNFANPKKADRTTEQTAEAQTAAASEPTQITVPAIHTPPPPVLIESPVTADESASRIQVTNYEVPRASVEAIPVAVEAPPARYLPVPAAPVLFESPTATVETQSPFNASAQVQESTPTHIISDWTKTPTNLAPVVASPRPSPPARPSVAEVLIEEPGLPPIVSPSAVRRPIPPVLTGENE